MNTIQNIGRLILMLGLMAGAALTSTAPASADQPYGGCKEAWQAPLSEGAEHCREHGWLIGRNGGYVVSPRHVLRYYDLPSCRNEDGSGQRATCGWNVTTGDGNGRGLVYLAITVNPHRDRYITLMQCEGGDCRYWRR